MSDAQHQLFAHELWPYFEACGYAASTILRDLPLAGARKAALAGFAQRPLDSRSACFTAIDVATNALDEAKACRDIGAPVTFTCQERHLRWWSQTEKEPYQIGSPIPFSQLEGFFREHAHDFAPSTIYRAKTLGRFESTYQRSFVDLGLMFVVEKKLGEEIESLLLESVSEIRQALGWPKNVDLQQGEWLVKSVFWLLGAKMLHDKGVEGFIRLNFGNVDEVFARLAAHYGESAETLITSQQKRRALESVAQRIASTADLRLTTTEALAYVYENTLISNEIRAELGTHSTPSYLVDYILGRLEPWIRQIPEDKRCVFEPACGHSAFLVAAVRLLTSLLPPHMAEPTVRKRYLRERIFGYDIDEFAIEIARLSLTLTDIPNPNGWAVKVADLFDSDLLERTAKRATILLSNTPFEDFDGVQRNLYEKRFRRPRFINRAAEILFRAISSLPLGGVIGIVIPQTLLHQRNSKSLRQLLVDDFEIQEICLFPDGVFNFADQESAVLIGRRHSDHRISKGSVRYRRVREREMAEFQKSYHVTSELFIDQSRFKHTAEFDLRVPDLESIWRECARLPKLAQLVEVGQGFSHKRQEDSPSSPPLISSLKIDNAVPGFHKIGHCQNHQLPPLRWLNLSADRIARPRSGTRQGLPQVLVNQAPVQRGPWCVRAMIDEIGRPAMSRFTILRPLSERVSLHFLWALINSPIGNAFAYSHSSKRVILAGTWRKFPVPDISQLDLSDVDKAVRIYLDFVNRDADHFLLTPSEQHSTDEHSKELCWRIDAEVLKLYALPATLERQLLDYFAGWKRVGVPFTQYTYLPELFCEAVSLLDFLAITADWDETNNERHALIEAKRTRTLSGKEANRLDELQRLAGLKRELHSSPSAKELWEIETDLKRRGLWRGI